MITEAVAEGFNLGWKWVTWGSFNIYWWLRPSLDKLNQKLWRQDLTLNIVKKLPRARSAVAFSFHDGFSSCCHINLSLLTYSCHRRGTFACIIKPHVLCAHLGTGWYHRPPSGEETPLSAAKWPHPTGLGLSWVVVPGPSAPRALKMYMGWEQWRLFLLSRAVSVLPKKGTLSRRELFLPYGFCHFSRKVKAWRVLFSHYQSVRT